jgi:hypothetical protein
MERSSISSFPDIEVARSNLPEADELRQNKRTGLEEID